MFTVPKRGHTKPVSAAQVRAYAAKAEEYALAAASELEAGRCIAATSLAIHAAINAADEGPSANDHSGPELSRTARNRIPFTVP